MSCINTQSNINETFIIEPIFVSGAGSSLSACTGLYTNEVISCDYGTTIFMGNGVIVFNGDMYTNNSIRANNLGIISAAIQNGKNKLYN